MNTKVAQQVINSFRPLLDISAGQCDQIGKSIPIPTFSVEIISQLCEMACSVFEKQDLVLELKTPIYVVGDIHGNLFDLIRILIHTSMPPHSRLLFLGDYVDRGEYSVEVVVLLFSLMICYPDCVFLLRGNHEFESMNYTYGFLNEVMAQYGSRELYDKFNDTFLYMPLVAILNGHIFCVHGGISPTLPNVQQINRIKRPLSSYETEYVADLVWSDPCYDTKSFNDSQRGLGVQFGVNALKKFLEKMNMAKVLRAHQCVMQGICVFGEGLLYTVFSSSNYADAKDNKCGLLFVGPSLSIEMFSLPMLCQVPRINANLKYVEDFAPMAMTADESLALNLKKTEIKERSRFSSSSMMKLPQQAMKPSNSMMIRMFTPSNSIQDFRSIRTSRTKSMNIPVELPKLSQI